MDSLDLIYFALPGLLLAYGIIAVVAGRRLPAAAVVLLGFGLGTCLALGCAMYVNSLMPPDRGLLGRFVKAYVLFYGLPCLTVTIAAVAARHVRAPVWAKTSAIVGLFVLAWFVGSRLSAGVVDFVNASG